MMITLILVLFFATSSAYRLPKEKITVTFKDTDIRSVLDFFAAKAGINIIYTDDVKGEVTLNLKDIPFDRALEAVIKLRDLVYTWEAPDLLKVTTPEGLRKQRVTLMTRTEIFTLKYADPKSIKEQLDSLRRLEGRIGETLIDEATNSLIVTDTIDGIEFVRNYIKKIDKKPPMVVIETKFYELSLSDDLEIGINWSYIRGKKVIDDAKKGNIGDTDFGIIMENKIPTVIAHGLALSLGYVTDMFTFLSTLGAYASEGKAKLIANPKITTMNNKPATILIGDKIPFRTTRIIGPGVTQETIEFLDVGIKLNVIPSISPDGWITMKVRPEISSPGVAPPGVVPAVSTREADVTVMVKDGDTLVLGGLTRETKEETISKIPLLGDIPLLGYLFKYKRTLTKKSELLVLLSPKILEEH